MNNISASDKYRKYIISLMINGKEYFTVWGCDIKNDEQDKILLDNEENILLFKKQELLIFLKQPISYFLFDKENFVLWAHDNRDTSPKYVYDIDSINRFLIYDISLTEVKFQNLFNCLHLFSDYAYQSRNDKIIKIYKSKHVSAFMDLMYKYKIWNSESSAYNSLIEDKLNLIELKKKIGKMLRLVMNKFSIN